MQVKVGAKNRDAPTGSGVIKAKAFSIGRAFLFIYEIISSA
jgi:hypothetical protein